MMPIFFVVVNDMRDDVAFCQGCVAGGGGGVVVDVVVVVDIDVVVVTVY
jgi:hypothetical protein